MQLSCRESLISSCRNMQTLQILPVLKTQKSLDFLQWWWHGGALLLKIREIKPPVKAERKENPLHSRWEGTQPRACRGDKSGPDRSDMTKRKHIHTKKPQSLQDSLILLQLHCWQNWWFVSSLMFKKDKPNWQSQNIRFGSIVFEVQIKFGYSLFCTWTVNKMGGLLTKRKRSKWHADNILHE